MKCSNCGVEWNIPSTFTSKIDVCPFCGKSLQPENPHFSSMDEVLSHIVSKFSTGAMKDGIKLQSLFADLAPHLKKEKILLRHFIECDGHMLLLQAMKEDKREAAAQITRVLHRMEDELMVMPDAAMTVCHSFWIAIGGSKDVLKSESAATPPTSVVPDLVTNPTTIPAAQTLTSNEDWRRSEAAHRQWIQSQNAQQKKGPVNGPSALVDVLEQRRLQMAHEHWSKSQNSSTSKPTASPPTSTPVEDWKRSEAAHRAWLTSQQKKK